MEGLRVNNDIEAFEWLLKNVMRPIREGDTVYESHPHHFGQVHIVNIVYGVKLHICFADRQYTGYDNSPMMYWVGGTGPFSYLKERLEIEKEFTGSVVDEADCWNEVPHYYEKCEKAPTLYEALNKHFESFPGDTLIWDRLDSPYVRKMTGVNKALK